MGDKGTRLGRLITAWRDSERFPPNDAQIARALGVSRQTIANWSTEVRRLPDPDNLRALAELMGTPYADVLDAVLRDAGYLVTETLERRMDAPPGRPSRHVTAETGGGAGTRPRPVRTPPG